MTAACCQNQQEQKLLLRTSSAAAAFTRPCLATVNKQHGEKTPVAPRGPSSTVTHSWVLRRTLPVCQLASLCHDTGGIGGWEEGHMCAALQALGCLHALRVFLYLWNESIEWQSDSRFTVAEEPSQNNARHGKTPGFQMTVVPLISQRGL